MVEEVLAATKEIALRVATPPRYAPSIFVRRHETLELDVA